MPRTIDPLLFLRENYQQKKKIHRDKDYLIFEGGIKLNLDTPTALVQSQTKKQYTLGSLWFYLIHLQESLTIYIRETQREGVDAVLSLDKEKIKDFFVNNVDNTEIVDNDLRPKTMIFLGKKRKNDTFVEAIASELPYSTQNKLAPQQNVESSNQDNFAITNDNNVTKRSQVKKRFDGLDDNLAIMEYIYTNEKKSLNRNTILKPITNVHSFESLLSFCKGIFTKNGKIYKQTETVSFLEELLSTDDLRSAKAIIVVPNNYIEGSLCLDNAKRFLENAQYLNLKTCSEECKEEIKSDNKKHVFTKKILGKELMFEICDNVRTFTRNEWKRVVGVFLQGDDWEFRDWPKSETVTSILQKVKGFHLKFQDMPLNDNVKKWNVKILEISRTKRHVDVSIQNEFWNVMNEFLSQPRKR